MINALSCHILKTFLQLIVSPTLVKMTGRRKSRRKMKHINKMSMLWMPNIRFVFTGNYLIQNNGIICNIPHWNQ